MGTCFGTWLNGCYCCGYAPMGTRWLPDQVPDQVPWAQIRQAERAADHQKSMNTRTAAYGRLLADLQARSAASDAAAAEALEELKAAGLALADRMAALADAMEAE